MRYKSAKFWFLSSAGLSFTSQCFATITVIPTLPWTTSAVSGSTKAYFGDSNSSANLPDTGDGYKAFTFSTLQSADSSRTHMLKFDVTTSVTSFTAGVVGVQAFVTGTTTYAFIPIVYFNGADCTASTCNTNSNWAGSTAYYFTANYTNATTAAMTVGIYIQDLCVVLSTASNSSGSAFTTLPAICSAGSYNQPATGSSAEVSLRFWIAEKNDTTSNLPNVTDTANSLSIVVNLSNGKPSLSCSNLENAYFPGDSKITLDTSTSIFKATANSSLPVSTLIATANLTTNSLSTEANFSSTNSINSRLTLGSGTQAITGFDNTTDGSDRKYDMKFAVRNQAGIMSSFGCELNPVQTSDVDGVLNTNNCFIATAAFGDRQSLPVQVLRQFRNDILYRFDSGIEFSRWYYSWSPEAAYQLSKYPSLRAIILRLLLPLVFTVSVILHPIVALIGIFLMMFGCFYLTDRQKLKFKA